MSPGRHSGRRTADGLTGRVLPRPPRAAPPPCPPLGTARARARRRPPQSPSSRAYPDQLNLPAVGQLHRVAVEHARHGGRLPAGPTTGQTAVPRITRDAPTRAHRRATARPCSLLDLPALIGELRGSPGTDQSAHGGRNCSTPTRSQSPGSLSALPAPLPYRSRRDRVNA